MPPSKLAGLPMASSWLLPCSLPVAGWISPGLNRENPMMLIGLTPCASLMIWYFRFDGRGFLEEGADQIYVVPSHGGTPLAMTDSSNGFRDPAWSIDGQTLYIVGNEADRPEMDPIESEIYALALGQRLTARYHGPRRTRPLARNCTGWQAPGVARV
jgi:hypothetical protein